MRIEDLARACAERVLAGAVALLGNGEFPYVGFEQKLRATAAAVQGDADAVIAALLNRNFTRRFAEASPAQGELIKKTLSSLGWIHPPG